MVDDDENGCLTFEIRKGRFGFKLNAPYSAEDVYKRQVELYTADMQTRLKENTWATKDHIIRTKLLPYFGKLKMLSLIHISSPSSPLRRRTR